jgi:hypothetical protein
VHGFEVRLAAHVDLAARESRVRVVRERRLSTRARLGEHRPRSSRQARVVRERRRRRRRRASVVDGVGVSPRAAFIQR